MRIYRLTNGFPRVYGDRPLPRHKGRNYNASRFPRVYGDRPLVSRRQDYGQKRFPRVYGDRPNFQTGLFP